MTSEKNLMSHIGVIRHELLEMTQLLRQPQNAFYNESAIKKGHRLELLFEQLEIKLATRQRKQKTRIHEAKVDQRSVKAVADERHAEHLLFETGQRVSAREGGDRNGKREKLDREMAYIKSYSIIQPPPKLTTEAATAHTKTRNKLTVLCGASKKRHSNIVGLDGQVTIKDGVLKQQRVELELEGLELTKFGTMLQGESAQCTGCWGRERMRLCHRIEQELAVGRAAILACQSVQCFMNQCDFS